MDVLSLARSALTSSEGCATLPVGPNRATAAYAVVMSSLSARTRRKLRPARFVVIAAASLSLGACGVTAGTGPTSVAAGPAPSKVTAGSFSGAGGPEFLSQAAKSTAKVTTQKVSMRIDTSAPIAFAVTIDGAVDNATKRSRLQMGIDGDGAEIGEALGGSFSMELVTDDQTVYVRSPLLTRLGKGDKPWLKVDASKWAQSKSVGPGTQDPGSFLTFLEGVGGTVTTVGREDIRGVATTHVRTTLDIAKVIDQAPAAEREKLQDQLNGLGGGGDALRDIPADAWLDDDGYVRKVVLSFAVPGGSDTGSTKDSKATITLELYDFNQPVDIKIPDPSEVGELDPALLGGN